MAVQSYRYDPFGNLSFGKPEYNNIYAYNAENYNGNTEHQYLRARYYDTDTADFLTEDSYLGEIKDPLSLNRYNYVKSSPPNYMDPSGHVSSERNGQYDDVIESEESLHWWQTNMPVSDLDIQAMGSDVFDEWSQRYMAAESKTEIAELLHEKDLLVEQGAGLDEFSQGDGPDLLEQFSHVKTYIETQLERAKKSQLVQDCSLFISGVEHGVNTFWREIDGMFGEVIALFGNDSFLYTDAQARQDIRTL